MTLWYLSRATGLVALVLFSLATALGALTAGRVASPAMPRFAISALHRNVSLLSLAFLLLHIVSATVDSYVPIRWRDTVVPFVSRYHPVWMGLGAVAFDLLLAVLLTSLVRTRLSLRLWRGVHWLSYLCWPVAVAHCLGLRAADADRGWILSLDIACIVAVVLAVGVRAVLIHPDTRMRTRAVR